MQAVVDVLAALLGVALLGYLALALRRRYLSRSSGTFDCSVRLRPSAHGRGWTLGIARYSADTLEWFRVFSFGLRPRLVLPRRDLAVLRRRTPTGPEALALLSGAVVLECAYAGRTVELGLSDGAVTGFLAWLEASPPGTHLDVA